MATRVQIGIEGDVSVAGAKDIDIRFTPVDIQVKDPEVEKAFKVVAAFLDSIDQNPGDGQGDIEIPRQAGAIKISFLKVGYDFEGHVFIRTTD